MMKRWTVWASALAPPHYEESLGRYIRDGYHVGWFVVLDIRDGYHVGWFVVLAESSEKARELSGRLIGDHLYFQVKEHD